MPSEIQSSNESVVVAGRRPLKTRSWPIFVKLASYLASREVTPNTISVASVLFSLAAGLTLATTGYLEHSGLRRLMWLSSAAFIQLRLIANLLDGMVAIEGGKKSAVGELYNEVPDRISDPLIFIGAGFAFGGLPSVGLLTSIVALFVAYVRAIGASVGVGQIFLGPFAKQQRMAAMSILCIASAILPSRLQPVHAETGVGICGATLMLIICGGIVTAVRRLMRIAELMRARSQGSGDAS